VVKAAPLVFTGLAVTVAFRAKFWNIGRKASFWRAPWPRPSSAPARAAGLEPGSPDDRRRALAGSVWALVPAMLKTRFKVDDVVTSLLLNFVLFYGMMALLDGPWKDPLSGYPDSPDIRMEAEFPILLRATRCIWGCCWPRWRPLGLAHAVPHDPGFEIDAVGENPNAARYAGINLAR